MATWWPALATTGIGSLPHVSVPEAIAFSFAHDLPFLPELPSLSLQELMLNSATSEVAPLASEAFVKALERAPTLVGKVQVVGPVTVMRAGGTSSSLQAQALARIALVQRAKKRPLIFFDEPLLGDDEVELGSLRHFLAMARAEGALVGLHCCGTAPWAKVLQMGFDVLSFDAERSLEAVLHESAAWTDFVSAGGTVCLGLVPTHPGAQCDIRERTLWAWDRLCHSTSNVEALSSQLLLSPACGLGLHSVTEATRIVEELRIAQGVLSISSRCPNR